MEHEMVTVEKFWNFPFRGKDFKALRSLPTQSIDIQVKLALQFGTILKYKGQNVLMHLCIPFLDDKGTFCMYPAYRWMDIPGAKIAIVKHLKEILELNKKIYNRIHAYIDADSKEDARLIEVIGLKKETKDPLKNMGINFTDMHIYSWVRHDIRK